MVGFTRQPAKLAWRHFFFFFFSSELAPGGRRERDRASGLTGPISEERGDPRSFFLPLLSSLCAAGELD